MNNYQLTPEEQENNRVIRNQGLIIGIVGFAITFGGMYVARRNDVGSYSKVNREIVDVLKEEVCKFERSPSLGPH